MNKKHTALLIIILIAAMSIVGLLLAHGSSLLVLSPKGVVAHKERNLLILATLLMLPVVIPVFVLLFGFAWKYRAQNTTAEYSPNYDHNIIAESVWWGLPCLIIIILAVVTWNSAHQLDPFKPLDSTVKPINVQVVALQWKWLFIYPDLRIATVNALEFPKSTPINLQITADAPMNSFWIPQLGGQVYAMPGMSTQLHLMADNTGVYRGVSANLSGKGFAGMKFNATATSQEEFTAWVASIRETAPLMTGAMYNALALPSEDENSKYYTTAGSELYEDVIMKFMAPPPASGTSMEGMDMSAMQHSNTKMQ